MNTCARREKQSPSVFRPFARRKRGADEGEVEDEDEVHKVHERGRGRGRPSRRRRSGAGGKRRRSSRSKRPRRPTATSGSRWRGPTPRAARVPRATPFFADVTTYVDAMMGRLLRLLRRRLSLDPPIAPVPAQGMTFPQQSLVSFSPVLVWFRVDLRYSESIPAERHFLIQSAAAAPPAGAPFVFGPLGRHGSPLRAAPALFREPRRAHELGRGSAAVGRVSGSGRCRTRRGDAQRPPPRGVRTRSPGRRPGGDASRNRHRNRVVIPAEAPPRVHGAGTDPRRAKRVGLRQDAPEVPRRRRCSRTRTMNGRSRDRRAIISVVTDPGFRRKKTDVRCFFSGGTSSTRHTEYRDGDDGGEQTVDAGERVGPVDGHRVARAAARRGGGVRGVGVVPSPSRRPRLGRVRGGRGVAENAPPLPAVGHAHRARHDRGRDEVLPLHDRVGGRARVRRRRGEGHASSHRPRAAQRVASFHRGVREVFLLHRVRTAQPLRGAAR